MMSLLQFLQSLSSQRNVPEKSIISFVGSGKKEYPLLFFSQIKSFLQKNSVVLEPILLDSMDSSAVKANFSTISFSGKIVYWINDFHELSLKKQQEWLSYFKSYEGPHTIIFFCNEDACVSLLTTMSNGAIVSLPHEVSLQDISMIRFLINDASEKTVTSVKAGLHVQVMSLDTLCLLNHYELVVGKNWDCLLREWGSQILEPSSSFFLLSQYFFGKKTPLFFSQWAHVHEMYMPAFWPSFWADQIWRAYVYCDLMRQKRYAEAKKAQYKLPYSLINRDWSSLSLKELEKAHDYLCTLDYRLKNGGSPAALELFFDTFFENKFR